MSNIDIHNNSFKEIIESLQNKIIELENKQNHFIYPQKWATGDGTAENPWANDCIQKALDFVPAGGTVYLKAGYYTLFAQAKITKKVNIIGEGRDKTIITTADANGFYIESVDYVTIKNLTIDGAAQTTDGTTYRCCIAIGRSDYILLENIEAKNAARYGIDTNTMNHSSLLNIYAHDNYRHGVHSGTDVSGNNMYNTYRDIYCWGNGVCGFDDRGNETYPEENLHNIYDNMHCWNNTEAGFSITDQKFSIISNCSASDNGYYGFNLRRVEDFTIHDIFVDCSGKEGIYITNSDNLNFTNVLVKNNNLNNSNYAGIMINDSTGIKFTSCKSYDNREIPLQLYGLSLGGTNTGISLLNCKLTPNKNGEIYNPNKSIISQWSLTFDDADLYELVKEFNALLVRIKTASEAINE